MVFPVADEPLSDMEGGGEEGSKEGSEEGSVKRSEEGGEQERKMFFLLSGRGSNKGQPS